jgi:ATP-dependent RNA helicase DBP3
MDNTEFINEKKEKKQKKEKKEKKEETEMTTSSPHVVENDEVVSSELKKKSDKKRKAEEPEAEIPQVISEEDDENERKRLKKEKKRLKKEQEKLQPKETENSSSAEKSGNNGNASSPSSSPNGNDANLYHEHSLTRQMSSSAVESFRTEHTISLDPSEAGSQYKPIESFEYLRPSIDANCPFIMKYIQQKGFKTPSPIQAQCWPLLLSGQDAIGIAATGSGKTLAFLIPAMLKISHLPSKPSSSSSKQSSSFTTPTPRVLVIAPTRELAMQSHQVVEEMNGPKGVCIYGGVPKQQQKQDLRNGADIVVATPGRLVDLIDEKALSLASKWYCFVPFSVYYLFPFCFTSS